MSRTPRWLGPGTLAAVLALSALSLRTVRPPAAVPATAPDTAFSAERAMVHVRAIATGPHPVGTVAHDRVRDYLATSLRALGLEPHVQTATALITRGARTRGATVQNVVARIRGTGSGRAVALVSHYDSEVLTPGAADAASGVAAILEAARALCEGPPLANDVIVLFTDAEETGLLGAEAFVSDHPWAKDVALVLNFEARGSAGPSHMFETGARNGWLLRAFAAHDPNPVASSLSYEVYRRMPNDTDFTVFRRAGIVGLNFAFIDAAQTYHQAFDTPANLSQASLQHHGEHALALARYFGSVDLGSTAGPDAVWFDVPGLGLIVYPVAWAVPLAGVATVALVGLLVWGLRSRRIRVRDLVAGIVVVPVGLILANRGAHLMMGHLYPLHAEHDLLQGRAQYVEGWYLLAVVALTWIPVVGLWILARRWVRVAGAALGALLVPAALALFTAKSAPGASGVVLWPTAGALASVYYLLRRPEAGSVGIGGALVLLVLALPTVTLLVPLLYLVFVAMNIELAPYLAVIAGLMLVLLYPLLDAVRRPNSWWSLATAAVLCAAFVAAGLMSRGVSAVRPAPTSVLYALDADSGVARWASGMEESDAWTRDAIPDGAERMTLERFLPGVRRTFRVAPAPVVALPASRIETLADEVVDGRRRVTLVIRSGVAVPYLRLRAGDPSQVRLLEVNGKAVGDGGGGLDLDYFGASGEGIVVTIESSTPTGPISLELWEHRYGLPAVPGRPKDRPPTLYPVASHWSDRTIVRRSVTIGG